MLGPKSRSGSVEDPKKKVTPPTPKVATLSKAAPPTTPPPSNGGAPPDRRRRSLAMPDVPTPGRRSLQPVSRISTPDKQLRGTKLPQDPLVKALRDELEMAKERLARVEEEKARVLADLETARTPEGETPCSSERDAIQSEVTGKAALLHSTVLQLERVRVQLVEALKAMGVNSSSTAADAESASELDEGTAGLLATEVARLSELLIGVLQKSSKENGELIRELEAEVSVLRLAIGKSSESEADAVEAAQNWQAKVTSCMAQIADLERDHDAMAGSLAAMSREVDESRALIHEKDDDIAGLEDKIRFLELQVAKHKEDTASSSWLLEAAQKEAKGLKAEVDRLKLEIEAVDQSAIDALVSEKEKLRNELEASQGEAERVKKAMDDMALALHEVSSEGRGMKEKYLAKQTEIENAQAQIEKMNSELKNTRESYELLLDEANYERVCLQKNIERLEREAKSSIENWLEKEGSFMASIKSLEEEIARLTGPMVNSGHGDAEDAKAESLEIESELHNVTLENGDEENAVRLSYDGKNQNKLSASLSTDDHPTATDYDEPVVVDSNMWDYRAAEYAIENDRANGASKAELESEVKISDISSADQQENGGVLSPMEEKKPLLKKFRGLLKKKGNHY